MPPYFDNEMRETWLRRRAHSTSSSCTIATDGSLNDVVGVETIDLTGHDGARGIRHICLSSPLEVIHVNGLGIRRDDTLEVVGISMDVVGFEDLKYPVEFIKVQELVRGVGSHPPKLRGLPITRTRHLLGKVSRKLNEVCLISQTPVSESSTSEASPALVEVELASVIQRRKLIITNALYPEHSMEEALIRNQRIGTRQTSESIGQIRRRIQETGTLVCRWRLKVCFRETRERRFKVEEESLERVAEEEAYPASCRVSDQAVCRRWRGERIKGGSFNHCNGSYHQSLDVEMADQDAATQTNAPRRSYTLFDAYCGAGGVSRGAQRAGFKVAYGVDKADKV